MLSLEIIECWWECQLQVRGSRLQVSEASLYPLAMAFDVCSQLLLSLLDTTGFQRVDDPLMTIDAAGPFGLLDTLAETTTI